MNRSLQLLQPMFCGVDECETIDVVTILLFCGVDEADANTGAAEAIACNFTDFDKTIDYAFIFSNRASATRTYADDDDVPPLG